MNLSEQESVIVKTLFINIKNWTKPSCYSKKVYFRLITEKKCIHLPHND